jgi:surface antigen
MQPSRKQNHEIEPNIRPKLGVIDGGGESTSDRGNLSAVDNARNLADQERRFGVIDGGGESTSDRGNLSAVDSNNNIDEAKNKEETANGWDNNFTGNSNSKQKLTGKGLFKKKGPVALLITLLFGGAVGIGSIFGGPSLIIVNLAEVMTNKFNTQLSSMDVRTTKVLAAKVSNTTGGVCSTGVSIRCKYSSMTIGKDGKIGQIDRFKDAGIKVNYNEADVKNGRVKPTSFEFTGSDNKLTTIGAKEFPKMYATSTEFRSAVKHAYNPKFAGYADPTFNKSASKMKVSKQAAFSETDNTDEKRTKAVQEITKEGRTGSTTKVEAGSKKDPTCDESTKACEKYTATEADAANKNTGAIGAEAEEVRSSGIKSATSTLADKATSVVKVTGIADNACSVYGAINAVSYGAKTIRSLQMIRYAMIFLNTASMIKAGTARPGDVSYIGNTITKVTGTNSKSATDSDGYRYAAGTFNGPIGKSASQYLAGGGLGGELSGVTTAVVSLIGGSPAAAKNTCKILRNPFVQTGSLLAGIALMIIPGGQAIEGSKIAGQVALAAVTFAAETILPSMLADMIAGVLVDSTTAGEDSGNAIASGASGMMSNVAGEGGNAVLHPDQAVAYNTLQQTTLAQYASEDRLAYSPLDPTNSNTFMGKIVTNLMPYATQLSSLSGIMRSTTSIVGSSVGVLVSPYTKAVSADDYKMCEDYDYRELNVATDIFCNPIRGIPPQYLNDDPNTINDRLAGQIDPESGEPITGSDYAKFTENCIGRTAPIGDGGADFDTSKDGSNCFIDSQLKADYYVHTIDQRVLDGMENGYATGASASSASETKTTTSTSGSAIKGDDYPYGKGPIDASSPLGYYTRECVDFVAWRLNSQNGTTQAPFQFGGYGHAISWRQNAISHGFAVDKKPTVGSVAWWGNGVSAVTTAGGFGHVAIVSQVNADGSIIVEQYNGMAFPNNYKYSTDTIPASLVGNLDYLHIADIKGGQS